MGILALLLGGIGLAGAAEPMQQVQASEAYVNNSGWADWLVPDYVVHFHVPNGVEWSVLPTTERARAAFAESGHAVSSKVVGTRTELTVVAGGRARRAGGYGRRNAWEYANELRVLYRRAAPRS